MDFLVGQLAWFLGQWGWDWYLGLGSNPRASTDHILNKTIPHVDSTYRSVIGVQYLSL